LYLIDKTISDQIRFRIEAFGEMDFLWLCRRTKAFAQPCSTLAAAVLHLPKVNINLKHHPVARFSKFRKMTSKQLAQAIFALTPPKCCNKKLVLKMKSILFLFFLLIFSDAASSGTPNVIDVDALNAALLAEPIASLAQKVRPEKGMEKKSRRYSTNFRGVEGVRYRHSCDCDYAKQQ